MTTKTSQQLHWYAYRVYHQKVKNVKEKLDLDGVQFFIPMRVVQEEKEDGFVYREEPILPSLMFIRSTVDYIAVLRNFFVSHLSTYNQPGTTTPAIIPDPEMNIFMNVLSKGCRQLEMVDQKLVKGNRVRIIGGWFKGSEGYIVRVHGTKRFVVSIDGVAAVATTFIPKEFIQPL